jgi:hypothetical protein
VPIDGEYQLLPAMVLKDWPKGVEVADGNLVYSKNPIARLKAGDGRR